MGFCSLYLQAFISISLPILPVSVWPSLETIFDCVARLPQTGPVSLCEEMMNHWALTKTIRLTLSVGKALSK